MPPPLLLVRCFLVVLCFAVVVFMAFVVLLKEPLKFFVGSRYGPNLCLNLQKLAIFKYDLLVEFGLFRR